MTTVEELAKQVDRLTAKMEHTRWNKSIQNVEHTTVYTEVNKPRILQIIF